MLRPVLVVAAALLGACGAAKQPTGDTAGGAVVRIPNATPEQLAHFDSDHRALPASHEKASRAHPSRAALKRDNVEQAQRARVGRPLPHGGPDCDAAALCCERIMQTSGNSARQVAVCDTFRHAPTSTCRPILDSFRRVLQKKGISCP